MAQSHRFVVNSMDELQAALANPREFSANYYGSGSTGRGWGRWTGVSSTGREVNEFGYQVYIHDRDIKYLMERDPTASYIVEGMAGDTWREWLKTDNELLNQILTEMVRMGLIDHMMAADISNRAYGIGLVVIGFKDGKSAHERLEPFTPTDVDDDTKGYDDTKDPRRSLRRYKNNANPDDEEDLEDEDLPRREESETPETTEQQVVEGDTDAADEALEEVADEAERERQEILKQARRIRDSIDYIEVYNYEEIIDFKFDTDPDSDTYGDITQYKVQVLAGDSTLEAWVHASRCIPFKEDRTTKAPVGGRVLDRIFDDLQLLRQTIWSASEGFYQRVVPPFLVDVKEDFTLNDEIQEKIDKAFKNFRTGVRDYIGVEGITVQPLSGASTTQDPEQTVRMLVSRIASGTGIPPRKLILAARGAVSESVEDRKEYESRIRLRQRTFAESRVRRFVDLLIDAGLLQEQEMSDFEVEWEPITPMSDLEAAQLEQVLGSTRIQYIQQGIPPPATLDFVPTENPDMMELLQQRGLPGEQLPGEAGMPGGGGALGHAADLDPGAGGGNEPQGLAALFAGLSTNRHRATNAEHSEPLREGRVDWNDAKVRRLLAQFESTLEAELYKAADAMENALIDQVNLLGDDPGVDDVMGIRVPEDLTKDLAKTLTRTMQNLAVKSANDLQKAYAMAAGEDTGALPEMSLNADGGEVVKRILKALGLQALVNAFRLAEDAEQEARQALATSFLEGGGKKGWLNSLTEALGQKLKQSIDTGSTAMATTVLNQGRDVFMQRNRDKVRLVEFRNPLDDRTSPICKGRADRKSGRGIVTEVGSETYYRNMPPLHWGCRSWWSPADPGTPTTDKEALRNLPPKQAGF